MKIKLDENLGVSVEAALIRGGHDIATVLQERLCGSGDHELIEICRTEGRALVTMDLDFANPFVFDPGKYPGIAVLRLPKKPGLPDLSTVIGTFVEGLKCGDLNGRLWVVGHGVIRKYEPGER